MATQIQWRRGTTAQTASFTGAVGEATVDTSKNTLVIHDGITAGGFPLARESALSANVSQIQASFNQANTAFITATSAGIYANGAFVSSNTIQTYVTSANANITAAFAAANAATETNLTQNNSITAAFTQANTGVNNALSASNYANASFLTANSATNTATAAFTRANNSISANAGGTITGDLVVTGNLTISGITTYANTQQLLVGDNLITLNAELPTSVTPVESAGIEINRGNTFANASLLWVESAGKWQANTGSATGAYFLADEAATTSAGIYANGAFTQANTDVTNVSVAAGTYGNTTHYGVVTVAANGRVTSVSTFAVSDPSSLAFSIALG